MEQKIDMNNDETELHKKLWALVEKWSTPQDDDCSTFDRGFITGRDSCAYDLRKLLDKIDK